jgi:hypothetical protein
MRVKKYFINLLFFNCWHLHILRDKLYVYSAVLIEQSLRTRFVDGMTLILTV